MTVNNPAIANDWQRERTELISRMRLDAYLAYRERTSAVMLDMDDEPADFPLGWDERDAKI